MSDLKPCPFCGGSDLEASGYDGREWQVCRDCGADGPIASSEDERAAIWNTRTPAPHITQLEAANAQLEADRAELVQALQDVANPLGKLQRNAEAEGSRLSGMAYQIANDIGFIQGIARATLSRIGEDGK